MRVLFATFLLASSLLSAGTVAREALNWHDRPIIGWRCPACGTRNAGDPQTAFHATCRHCESGYEWRRILPARDAESTTLAVLTEDRSRLR